MASQRLIQALFKDGHSIHLKSWEPSIEERENNGIEDLYEEILSKSADVIQQLRNNRPYGKECYVTEPDGNIIAFVRET